MNDIYNNSALGLYEACRLCPRGCGARRLDGEAGFCGETAELRIAAMLPHFGEEPCISGTRGSGAVFFSGCSCGCFFCQNHQISHGHEGRAYGPAEFTEALAELAGKGVHNLNFVTPDHFWPHVKAACRQLRERGLELPFLWNCSGYSSPEFLEEQLECIDIFLPDFKYARPGLADTCMGDSKYPDIALAAIARMVDATGFLRPWGEDRELTSTRGTLVRHLVLPGELDNSIRALDILYDNFGPLLPLSIMSQFQPMPECFRRGLFTEKISAETYDKVLEHAESLGFQRVFSQYGMGDDGFAPDFSSDNPFGSGNTGLKR